MILRKKSDLLLLAVVFKIFIKVFDALQRFLPDTNMKQLLIFHSFILKEFI